MFRNQESAAGLSTAIWTRGVAAERLTPGFARASRFRPFEAALTGIPALQVGVGMRADGCMSCLSHALHTTNLMSLGSACASVFKIDSAIAWIYYFNMTDFVVEMVGTVIAIMSLIGALGKGHSEPVAITILQVLVSHLIARFNILA